MLIVAGDGAEGRHLVHAVHHRERHEYEEYDDVNGDEAGDGIDDSSSGSGCPSTFRSPDRLRVNERVDVDADLLEQHDKTNDLDPARGSIPRNRR